MSVTRHLLVLIYIEEELLRLKIPLHFDVIINSTKVKDLGSILLNDIQNYQHF